LISEWRVGDEQERAYSDSYVPRLPPKEEKGGTDPPHSDARWSGSCEEAKRKRKRILSLSGLELPQEGKEEVFDSVSSPKGGGGRSLGFVPGGKGELREEREWQKVRSLI
jgi:hypothetical protein